MQRIIISGTAAAANPTGYASNVTGATFTLSASNSGDGLAHLVTIHNDSITNHSNKTVTLVGTDADGRAQTEVVTGPGASATVTSTKYFLTLTGATPSATIGGDTFDIGWADNAVSPAAWFVGVKSETFAIGFGCSISGTPTYTVQHTYGDDNWYSHPTVANKTTAQEGSYSIPVGGVRLLWTAAGYVKITMMLSGNS